MNHMNLYKDIFFANTIHIRENKYRGTNNASLLNTNTSHKLPDDGNCNFMAEKWSKLNAMNFSQFFCSMKQKILQTSE